MGNQACGKIEESEKSFDKKTDDFVSFQTVSPTEEAINSSENSQSPIIETINYVIYSSDEIEYDELKFIDEYVYEAIYEINSSIDYYGTFKNKDITDKKSILEKYYEVIVGEDLDLLLLITR